MYKAPYRSAAALAILLQMLLGAGVMAQNGNGNSTTSQIAGLQSQINTVQSNLDAAKALLQQAINNEANARATQDAALLAQINQVQSNLDLAKSQLQAAISAGDAALKSQLDAVAASLQATHASLQTAIDSEAAARQSADQTLQNNIDAVDASLRGARTALDTAIAAEAAARTDADNALRASVEAEQVARRTADRQLDEAVAAVNEALAAETAARGSADAQLQAAVAQANEAISAETVARQAALNAEAAARQTGDSELRSALNAEASARQAAVTNLQGLVNAANAAINAEASAREAAVAALRLAVNALNVAITDERVARETADGLLLQALNTEASNRAAADALLRADLDREAAHLNGRVNGEEAARLRGDSDTLAAAQQFTSQQVAEEATARQAALSNVQNQIDGAGNPHSLRNQISDEAAARQQADANLQNQLNGPDPSSLQNQITAEAGQRQAGDTSLQARLDTSSMTTDQAIQALTERLNAMSTMAAPVGSIVAFAGPYNKIPAGWMLCDGRVLPRSAEYQPLFDAISTSWGAPDAGTFRIPDLRGRFLRGLDSSPVTGSWSGRDPYWERGQDYAGGNSGLAVGSVQGDSFAAHSHRTIMRWLGSLNGGEIGWIGNIGRIAPEMASDSNHVGGTETRPENAAVNYIIRVK